MTLTNYLEPRVFRSPYLKRSESVSGTAVLWAFLLGPAYYWRKQAPVEALVLSLIDTVLMLMPGSLLGTEAADGLLGSAVWLGFALGAPVLLPMCYRRKGWVEIGSRMEARWLSSDLLDENDADERMNQRTEHPRRERVALNRDGRRNRLPLRQR